MSDEIRAYKSSTMLPLISYSIRRYKQQSLHQTFSIYLSEKSYFLRGRRTVLVEH